MDDGARRPTETPWMPAGDAERLREVAFALILAEGRGVTTAEIAGHAGVPEPEILLRDLAVRGWIDRAADGSITGSVGLSTTHGPHELRVRGNSFRTWCAYDALGIPAALAVDAEVDTSCAVCARPIHISILGGRPSRSGPEVLWMAPGDGDLRATFCTPTVLLCGRRHGRAWAASQGNGGRLMSLVAASAMGALDWARAATTAREVGTVEFIGGPWNGRREERLSLPAEIGGPAGRYVRSVRCADDEAMRYVWRGTEA